MGCCNIGLGMDISCGDFRAREEEQRKELIKHLEEIAGKNGKFLKLLLKQYKVISVSTSGRGSFVDIGEEYVYDEKNERGFRHLIEYEDLQGNKFQWAV